MVHRDLKPSNIILKEGVVAPGSVKVVDFGLAKLICDAQPDNQKLTATGLLIGSVHYMSPEQCLGRKADHRSDIYSIGCLLYEVLSGRTLFECDNPIGMLYRHINDEPDFSLLSVKDGESSRLEFILRRALQKSPDARYASMAAMLVDLRRVEAGEVVQDVSGQKRGLATGKLQLIPALLIVAVVLCGLFFVSYFQRRSKDEITISGVVTPTSKRLSAIEKELLENSVKQDAGSRRARCLLCFEKGNLLAKERKYQEAEQAFREGMRWNDYLDVNDYKRASLVFLFGETLYFKGDPAQLEECKNVLTEAIEICDRTQIYRDPAGELALRNIQNRVCARAKLAVVLSSLGDFASARQRIAEIPAIARTSLNGGISDKIATALGCRMAREFTDDLIQRVKPVAVNDRRDFAAMILMEVNFMAESCPEFNTSTSHYLDVASKYLDGKEMSEVDEREELLQAIRVQSAKLHKQ